jgi:hypothetical protein
MCTWFNIWWGESVNQNAFPFVIAFIKAFAPTNKGLGRLSLLIPPRFPCYFKFCMLLMRVSHSKASCCGVSIWRLLICQSTYGLCRTSQDNPMMTWFLRDEMTLKITLLVWEPMVTLNDSVSCMINLDERFQPSTISTGTSVFFSTRTNSYFCTNSLSIKHVHALKSRSAWTSIVMSLLHLTMIGTKKHGVGSKNRLGPFSLHDASRSRSLLKLDMLIFWLFWLWISNSSGGCYMWSTFLWTITSNMALYFTIQTKIVCMSTLLFLLREGFEYNIINLHGFNFWQGCWRLG